MVQLDFMLIRFGAADRSRASRSKFVQPGFTAEYMHSEATVD